MAANASAGAKSRRIDSVPPTHSTAREIEGADMIERARNQQPVGRA